MATQRSLVVIEPIPVLFGLICEQMAELDSGWIVKAAQNAGMVSDESVPNAALIAASLDPALIASHLRAAGMVGPIFTIGDPVDALPPPLIVLPTPFRISRFLALLEKPGKAAIDGLKIGPWFIDASRQLLDNPVSGLTERLTDREMDILIVLANAAPGAVTRETLLEAVWNYHSDATTHTVETHIWRLRQKLEQDPSDPVCLPADTKGYRLVLDRSGDPLLLQDSDADDAFRSGNPSTPRHSSHNAGS